MWGFLQARRAVARRTRPALYYVVPGHEWSIDWDGRYITAGIKEQFGWDAQVVPSPNRLAGQILHYGSVWSFLAHAKGRHNLRNTVVITVFHGDRSGKFPELAEAMERFLAHAHLPARIVTACRLMEQRLISWGTPADKVLRIPLGVDLARFRLATDAERLARRRALGIPNGAFCVGSFQKDGEGWGEGLAPKLMKGPDVFLGVIKRLARRYRLHVMLTGPARGYVTRGLDALGVSYHHRHVSDYRDVAPLYHGLDLYLVTSREEGGPKGILEAMACGVPVVSTTVGMAPDVIEHDRNGLLAPSEDVEMLATQAARVIEQPAFGRQLAAAGLTTIAAYDWKDIAARYYRALYLPLLRHRES